MAETLDTEALLDMTVSITTAHVSHNSVTVAELPEVIRQVHGALRNLANGGGTPVAAESEALVPAVPIKKSVKSDHIVCLECGQKLKMLKRHLVVHHNLTPAAYRARWSLPAKYPMVAADYAAQRSDLAKLAGLGQSRVKAKPVVKAKRGRPPKVRPAPEPEDEFEDGTEA